MNEDQEKRRLRDEVAELAQAVKELREQLGQQQHTCCHGCTCIHWHYTPVPYYPTTTLPYTVTYGSGSSVSAASSYQAIQ